MSDLSPAELAAWINGTCEAQNAAFVTEVANTEPDALAYDFDVPEPLAARLRDVLARLRPTLADPFEMRVTAVLPCPAGVDLIPLGRTESGEDV